MKASIVALFAFLPVVACGGSGDDAASPASESELQQVAAADLTRFALNPRLLRDPKTGEDVGGAAIEFDGDGFSRAFYKVMEAAGITPEDGQLITMLSSAPYFSAHRSKNAEDYHVTIAVPGTDAELSLLRGKRKLEIFGEVVDAIIALHVRAGVKLEPEAPHQGRQLKTKFISCVSGVVSMDPQNRRFCTIDISF